jgi:phosphoglycerate dehydrogenase-like enzyme
MMPKVLVLTKYPDDYRRLIEAEALPDIQLVTAADVEDGLARGRDSDVLVGDPARVVAALPHMARLRWVQLTWAGVERMLDPALRRDYVLTNIRGVFGPLMSEFVFGYLLAHERKIVQRLESQRAGRWDATLPGTLRGRTLGLVGVGSIGAHLASTAKHFGMRVHGYTRASEECRVVDRYFHGADRATFARDLDYLVAVLPNTPGTRRIVDAAMFGALPPHAVVVNAGRGDTLDTEALIAALHAGRLGGAILDVFEEEPLPEAHPLWRTPGVLITSHTAAPSFPADIVGVFAMNYRRYVAGEPLLYAVDFDRGY